jgi:hypothetical protein
MSINVSVYLSGVSETTPSTITEFITQNSYNFRVPSEVEMMEFIKNNNHLIRTWQMVLPNFSYRQKFCLVKSIFPGRFRPPIRQYDQGPFLKPLIFLPLHKLNRIAIATNGPIQFYKLSHEFLEQPSNDPFNWLFESAGICKFSELGSEFQGATVLSASFDVHEIVTDPRLGVAHLFASPYIINGIKKLKRAHQFKSQDTFSGITERIWMKFLKLSPSLHSTHGTLHVRDAFMLYLNSYTTLFDDPTPLEPTSSPCRPAITPKPFPKLPYVILTRCDEQPSSDPCLCPLCQSSSRQKRTKVTTTLRSLSPPYFR